MRLRQFHWTADRGWSPPLEALGFVPGLVLCFGRGAVLEAALAPLRDACPQARIVVGGAQAVMRGAELDRDGAVAVALRFKATPFRIVEQAVAGTGDDRRAGQALGAALAAPDLAGVLVLADGIWVNGSELLAGLRDRLGRGCALFGGMLSDTERPEEPGPPGLGIDGPPRQGLAAAIGFYGPHIRIGAGAASGVDPFGPRRVVTCASGSLLQELDGRPALELYRRYLGDEFVGSSDALTFPLLVWPPGQPEQAVVRTLIRFDPATGSMSFAGNVPAGHLARLMRGDLDRVAMAAADAARQARAAMPALPGDRLALMVSCIGRLQLLGERAAEEVEDAALALGEGSPPIGFYGYGEICCAAGAPETDLHNQTMTTLLLAEAIADD
ncbi:FIST signal transduction protein [Roseomonas sp. 18066]|uniref:FIST signal transduction protein n=1 Tax=Roseomonas sp. 18066 TaxID=2681412 RepID=UPI001356B477|nr:FIST C-terminal domain-containing protein [Roseomonas sp. 18066]